MLKLRQEERRDAGRCPLCKGRIFLDYGMRQKSVCASCGSKERHRFLGLVIQRILPKRAQLPILHLAPEKSISQLLYSKYRRNYIPVDLHPELYAWCHIPLEKLDLLHPLDYFPRHSVQGIVHSHVLEHIPRSMECLIHEMNEMICPGGFHLFQVPIEPGCYRENLDQTLSGEDRIHNQTKSA